jgi:hypothetical protein
MKKQSSKQPLRESLIKIGGGHLLKEYNDKVSKYSDELGGYIKLLRPNIRGWKFGEERMTGSWYWEHPKFEDVIYATWGWEGKNEIPLETSDGESFKTIKLKLTPKESSADKLDIKKDVKKYIDAMKKEIPKIQKKLLDY